MTTSSTLYGIGVAALAIVSTGCVSYIPTELETVAAGADVRVYLTPERMAELRAVDELGLPQEAASTLLNGTLVRRGGAGLGLRIPIASREIGFLRSPILRELNISPSDILRIQLRELDRGRSALAIAGSAGLLAALLVAMLSGAENRVPPSSGPDPEASRIPLLLSSLFQLFHIGDPSRSFPAIR